MSYYCIVGDATDQATATTTSPPGRLLGCDLVLVAWATVKPVRPLVAPFQKVS